MTALERLAAAIDDPGEAPHGPPVHRAMYGMTEYGDGDASTVAQAIFDVDPTLAEDLEETLVLRDVVDALPLGWDFRLGLEPGEGWWATASHLVTEPTTELTLLSTSREGVLYATRRKTYSALLVLLRARMR